MMNMTQKSLNESKTTKISGDDFNRLQDLLNKAERSLNDATHVTSAALAMMSRGEGLDSDHGSSGQWLSPKKLEQHFQNRCVASALEPITARDQPMSFIPPTPSFDTQPPAQFHHPNDAQSLIEENATVPLDQRALQAAFARIAAEKGVDLKAELERGLETSSTPDSARGTNAPSAELDAKPSFSFIPASNPSPEVPDAAIPLERAELPLETAPASLSLTSPTDPQREPTEITPQTANEAATFSKKDELVEVNSATIGATHTRPPATLIASAVVACLTVLLLGLLL